MQVPPSRASTSHSKGQSFTTFSGPGDHDMRDPKQHTGAP